MKRIFLDTNILIDYNSPIIRRLLLLSGLTN